MLGLLCNLYGIEPVFLGLARDLLRIVDRLGNITNVNGVFRLRRRLRTTTAPGKAGKQQTANFGNTADAGPNSGFGENAVTQRLSVVIDLLGDQVLQKGLTALLQTFNEGLTTNTANGAGKNLLKRPWDTQSSHEDFDRQHIGRARAYTPKCGRGDLLLRQSGLASLAPLLIRLDSALDGFTGTARAKKSKSTRRPGPRSR